MIMKPDQATFNEFIINALPSHIRDELVMCDQVSVDYSTHDELWTTVLRVDHVMDSLKVIQAYKTLGQPKVNTTQSASKPTTQNYSSKMNSYKSNKPTYMKQV